MQNQGKIIATEIKKRLERLGKVDTNNPSDPNQASADNILANYSSPSWNADLTTLLQDFFVQIYMDSIQQSVGDVGVAFSANPMFDYQAQTYAQQRAAKLVTQLDDSTRQMLKATLVTMMDEGKTPQEIATALEQSYAFSDARAFTISRTETAFSYNHAAIETYRQSGAKAVRVYDGDHDPECREADGQVWTFDYAIENLISHPNCVRSFGPEMDDVTPDRGLEAA